MEAGQDMRVTPVLGWVVPVPDANATVDLDIGGSLLKFAGVGYHDQVR